jgi:hypothetical protein
MTNHLSRCRSNWKKNLAAEKEVVPVMTCRYNSYHVVPSPEIIFHEQRCNDRNLITTYLIEFKKRKHHLETNLFLFIFVFLMSSYFSYWYISENDEDCSDVSTRKTHHVYTTYGKPFDAVHSYNEIQDGKIKLNTNCLASSIPLNDTTELHSA